MGNLSQPPAKHKPSPTIGSQENNKAQRPHFSTARNAFCLCGDRFSPRGHFTDINIPKIHVVSAPSVLPTVATVSNTVLSKVPALAKYAKTASEPPGARVAETNALTNSPSRENPCSGTKPIPSFNQKQRLTAAIYPVVRSFCYR